MLNREIIAAYSENHKKTHKLCGQKVEFFNADPRGDPLGFKGLMRLEHQTPLGNGDSSPVIKEVAA